MLSLAAPAWLLGLALLPLLRWLHRGGRHRRVLPVSRLALWQGSAAASLAAGRRQPPDPAWRRRALLLALLLLALAQPQWPQRERRVTVWVDDSLSLLTREGQGTRLAAGLAQLRAELAAAAPSDLELRTLGDPWRSLGAPGGVLPEATAQALAASVGRHPPAAPPAALLAGDREHWLLTDAAHPALMAWPGGRVPDRLLRMGSSVRNAGVLRLAARPRADAPDRVDLLVQLVNGGREAETRALVVTADGAAPLRSAHTLAPAEVAQLQLSMPRAAAVRARLEPADALPEDDELALDLAALARRRVAVDGRCAPALRAAVAAHPALTVAPAASAANTSEASGAAAVLDCGGARPGLPTVRLLATRLPQPLPGDLQWPALTESARRPTLDAQLLRSAARIVPAAGDTVWLAAAGEPLIVRRGGPVPLVETSLDLAAAGTARGPELPLLVNLLFERLFDAPLLELTASVARAADASVVAAAADPSPAAPAAASAPAGAARPGPGPQDGVRRRDATPPLLWAALLVVLWELAALGRQGWRLRDTGQAGWA